LIDASKDDDDNDIRTSGEYLQSIPKVIDYYARSLDNPKFDFYTWYYLLKLNKIDLDVKFLNKPPPGFVSRSWRRFLDYLTVKYFLNLKYDPEDKLDNPLEMKISAQATYDGNNNYITIQTSKGKQSFAGFKSNRLNKFAYSTSRFRISNLHSFNLPICSVQQDSGKIGINTFDDKKVVATPGEECRYLVSSNCKGNNTFLVVYRADKRDFEIIYHRKYKIIAGSDVTVNGENKTPESGKPAKYVDDIKISNEQGLFVVSLPNRVTFYLQPGTDKAYLKASRIYKGSLCGLCGNLDTNLRNDKVDPRGCRQKRCQNFLNSWSTTDQCPSTAEPCAA